MFTKEITLLSASWYNIRISITAEDLHKQAQTCSHIAQYHKEKPLQQVHEHSVNINLVASSLLTGPNRCLSPRISESKQPEHVQKLESLWQVESLEKMSSNYYCAAGS